MASFREPLYYSDKLFLVNYAHHLDGRHHTVTNTLKIIYDEGFKWAHIKRDIRMVVKNCPCQAYKKSAAVPNDLHTTPQSYEERLDFVQAILTDTSHPRHEEFMKFYNVPDDSQLDRKF
jgi:hypothetical protein